MYAVLLGLAAGLLSGHFGLGGGLITTPGIRLLGYGPYLAVGTPLLINIPTALSGAWTYARHGYFDGRLVRQLALSGAAGSVLGSFFTKLVNPHLILFITAVVIFRLSLGFLPGRATGRASSAALARPPKPLIGVLIGVSSGFLGLGGGFLLIPYLSLVLGRDMKTTFGTSLAVISAITVPGAIVHWWLGHIDIRLGLTVIAGVIPGAVIGARIAISMPEEFLRIAFATLLILLSFFLGYSELAQLV